MAKSKKNSLLELYSEMFTTEQNSLESISEQFLVCHSL